MKYESHRDRKEYFSVGVCSSGEHFHRAIEIVCCIKEPKQVFVSGVEYTVCEGEVLFVPPCAEHVFPKQEGHVSLCAVLPVVYTDIWEKYTGGKLLTHPIITDRELSSDIYQHLSRLPDCKSDLTKNGIYSYVLGVIMDSVSLSEHGGYENTAFALRTIDYLEKNYFRNISLEEVSRALGYNRCYFSTLFNRNFHMGFRIYLNTMRIDRSLLLVGKHSAVQVAHKVGFESVQVYYSNFRRVMGCTPTEYMSQLSAL